MEQAIKKLAKDDKLGHVHECLQLFADVGMPGEVTLQSLGKAVDAERREKIGGYGAAGLEHDVKHEALGDLGEVIITDMSGESLCEVSIGAECTVRGLKQKIERITRVPAVEQQLTCSEVILDDEDASVSLFRTGDPLVVLMIVPQWTDEQIKAKTEELQRLIDVDDEKKVGAALATLPYHEADEAEVLSPLKLYDVCGIFAEVMKGAREPCTVAVTQCGLALKWASVEMKGDREVCMAAVTQDGTANGARKR